MKVERKQNRAVSCSNTFINTERKSPTILHTCGRTKMLWDNILSHWLKLSSIKKVIKSTEIVETLEEIPQERWVICASGIEWLGKQCQYY